MAKWTGGIKRVKRWFRSDKLLVEFRKEEGDHNPENWPELCWWEVDALRLDIIAFDLECRRNEVEALSKENARLREKLVNVGSDTKVEVTLASPRAAEELAVRLSRLMKEQVTGFIQKHADWISKPADVDLRTAEDAAKKFAGGLSLNAMPESAQPPKGR